MKRIYFIFLILFFSLPVIAGDDYWEFHLSKLHTTVVVKGNNKIYFLSEGGIFYFNKTDNSVVTLTKIDRLSGSDFSGMEYSYATNNLIVFYKNSMIDIVSEDDNVYPISAIKMKNISGNKSIYNATCVDDLCYLSCGFGIVVLDLTKREIKDTFIIGDNGSYDLVYDVAIDDQNIYAGTSNGIKIASKDAPNLLDFNYWQKVEHKFIEDYNFNFLVFGVGRIWAIHKGTRWHDDKILSRHDAETWYYEYSENEVVNSLQIEGDMLAICGANAKDQKIVSIYQNKVVLKYYIDRYKFNDLSVTPFGTDTIKIDPRSAIIDTDGTVWIADYNYGAIRYKDGVFDIINPGGPVDNNAFSMTFSNNKLWVASGGRNGSSWDNLYMPAVFQSYVAEVDKWEAFNSYTHPVLKDMHDVVKILPSPGDPNHIYVATWGGGILEFKDGKYITTYNENNSSLQNIFPGQYFLRVGGMDFDANGNLWVSNSEVNKCISVKKTDGSWKSFPTPEIAYDYKLGELIVSKDDNIWLIVPREKTSGLYVMSSDGKNQKPLNVVSYFTNGEEELFSTMNNVFCLAEDNIGDIWVGTSKGVTVYPYPEKVFDQDPFYSSQPGLDLNDGFFHPLLQIQTVTAIAVDGGNRKYLGTKGSGVYLVSADGTEEIEHYTTENSSLISDDIVSLAYDGINGTLFIGTNQGIVTLLTESKKSFDHFTNVYAYPNPVRSTYEGDIYITGLMEDTNVKITTVSGQLVSEFTSVGGQAAWDGRDLSGKRVQTGVYFVLCASKDGQESAITKILFFRGN